MDGPDGALLKANPHTMEEKRGSAGSPQPASGIPVLPFYPHLIRLLTPRGIPDTRLEEITHDAICRAFGIHVAKHRCAPEYNLAGEYGFDPFVSVKRAN